VPISQRFAPETMASRHAWRFYALVAQGVGLVLIFLGTAIMVLFGYVPVNCVGATTCSGGTYQGILYGIDIARFLWTLGLFGIALGAGIQLQFRTPPTFPSTAEETRVYLAHRRGEFIMLVVSLVLLFLITLLSTGAVPIP
jgi:hypothetical protein